MGVVGIPDLLGIGFGHGGHHVSAFDGALHHVDAAGEVHDTPEGLRKTQHVVKEVRVGPALILNVVDGEDRLGIGEDPPVLGVQVHRNHGSLPVVGLDHIRVELEHRHGVQHSLGEEGVPLAVIQVTIEAVPAKVILIVDEIHRGLLLVALGFQLVQAGILLPPGQTHPELCAKLRLVSGVFFHPLVVREEQADLIVRDSGQFIGQAQHHIAQAARLDIGGSLRGCHGNFHTISPRLTIMGFSGVPMRRTPGRTTTSLSKMAQYNSAPAPMEQSFMITQFLT